MTDDEKKLIARVEREANTEGLVAEVFDLSAGEDLSRNVALRSIVFAARTRGDIVVLFTSSLEKPFHDEIIKAREELDDVILTGKNYEFRLAWVTDKWEVEEREKARGEVSPEFVELESSIAFGEL